VLGDKEVGKSSLARSQLEAIAAKFVDPDSQAIVYPTKFEMNVGTVEFDIWDLWLEHSEEVRETILPAYYDGAHVAVLMFDFTSRESYRNIAEWYRAVRQACGDIPIIVCGNKFDINEDVIPPKSIQFHRKRNLPYLRISTKYSYNVDKLFWLLATLFIANGEEEVQFVQPPSLSVSGGMDFLNPTAERSWLPPSNDEDEGF
jgi:GTP-binding nuclear protein Ran